MPNDYPDHDQLLRPREVAEIFGVRTTTIARWAREGRLMPLRTPGGHRRYSREAVVRLLAQDATPDEAERQWAEGAARLPSAPSDAGNRPDREPHQDWEPTHPGNKHIPDVPSQEI